MAGASGAPASVAPSALVVLPASVQGEGVGGDGWLLATQRHQLLALVWRQIVTVGSHMPPSIAPSAPPSIVADGQSATPETMLVTVGLLVP